MRCGIEIRCWGGGKGEGERGTNSVAIEALALAKVEIVDECVPRCALVVSTRHSQRRIVARRRFIHALPFGKGFFGTAAAQFYGGFGRNLGRWWRL